MLNSSNLIWSLLNSKEFHSVCLFGIKRDPPVSVLLHEAVTTTRNQLECAALCFVSLYLCGVGCTLWFVWTPHNTHDIVCFLLVSSWQRGWEARLKWSGRKRPGQWGFLGGGYEAVMQASRSWITGHQVCVAYLCIYSGVCFWGTLGANMYGPVLVTGIPQRVRRPLWSRF